MLGLWIFLGAMAVVVVLVAWFGLPAARRRITSFMAGNLSVPDWPLNPLSWIEVLPDNRIRLYVPKAEMGQGAHTGLAQLVAEELEVPWDRLEVVHASTRQAENKHRGTFGSISIASLYRPMRRAAATMREMLRTEASARLGVAPEQLVARDGRFELIGDSSRAISYSELVQGNPKWQKPRTPVALKSPEQFKVIGRSLPRVDAPAKVTGRAVYGQDARVEKVLYGALVRPPTVEARMLSARAGKAQSMPGVVKVVIEKDFAGVVAKSQAQARAARDAIEVTWDTGRLWQQSDLEALVTVGETHGVNILRKRPARSTLTESATLNAEYRTGLASHASMEPQAALAVVTESGARVWTSTQFETLVARQVAKALGLKAGQVEVIPTFLGGGFGGREGGNPVCSAAIEAARLSRAADAPVHVSWDREEEFRNGYMRPMTHHQISAKLSGGKIEALEWREASGDSVMGLAPGFVARLIRYDPGAASGAWIYYDIPHRDITVWRRPMPLLTGQWRGLGFMLNSFAIESFIDEAAHAAGRDPLQFRLDHLPTDENGKRMAAVLRAAAERAGWGETAPAGHGRGLACCSYHGTVVAEVADISLDEATGQIRLHRVVAALDCGHAINPDQVRGQMEGCIVMGASSALMEELTVKDGRLAVGSFANYPFFTMMDAPEIETILVETPDRKPSGVGEAPIGPIAPAIANALFALSGARMRQLPMTQERVLRALAEREANGVIGPS